MFGKPPRTKKELRRQSEELGLLERMVLLALTVVLAVVSVVSPLCGAHWTVPAGSGVGAGLSALGARLRR
jgi:hypothetical protein